MQVARYWRNKRLLYQLRRNRDRAERGSVEAQAPDREMVTRRAKAATKVVVA